MSKYQENLESTYSQEEVNRVKKTIQTVTIVFAIFALALVLFGYINGWFDSAEPLTNFALELGWFGFFLLSLMTIAQNIMPIIPGDLPGVAMFVAYGPVFGFVWAVICIIVGSLISFCLSKRYGLLFVNSFVDKTTYDKWIGKIYDKKSATKFALLGLWVPGIYDGAVVMILGLTKMSFRRFTTILLLSKPLPTLFYFLIASGAWSIFVQLMQVIL